MTQTVETFRGISFLIVKWLFYALVVIVGVGALIAGIVLGYEHVTHDRHAENVSVVIFTAREKCFDDQFPLMVGVVNGSAKTLASVSLTLEARRKRHSTNLASYASYDSDRILKPGEGWGLCWRAQLQSGVKDDPRSLEWKLGSRSLTFANE